MRSFRINSIDAVNNFLLEMYCRTGKIFDPADDLRNLCNKDGQYAFTKEESEYLDGVMTECFIYCIYSDVDIYNIVQQVQSELSQTKAVA